MKRNFYFYEDVVPIRLGGPGDFVPVQCGKSFMTYHWMVNIILHCPSTTTPKPYYGA